MPTISSCQYACRGFWKRKRNNRVTVPRVFLRADILLSLHNIYLFLTGLLPSDAYYVVLPNYTHLSISIRVISIFQLDRFDNFVSIYFKRDSVLPLPHPKPCPNMRNRCTSSPHLHPSRFVCVSHFAPCFFRRKKNLISETATIFSSTSETGIHIRNMPVFSFVEATLKLRNAFCLSTFFRVSFVERLGN